MKKDERGMKTGENRSYKDEIYSRDKVNAILRVVVEDCINDERRLIDVLRVIVYSYPGVYNYIKRSENSFYFSSDILHGVDMPRCCAGVKITFTGEDCGICVTREYFYDKERVRPSGSLLGNVVRWAEAALKLDGIIKK